MDLAAAYDTEWHRGLTCKLLRTLPDRHIVSFTMELVRSCNFTLTTGNDAQIRLRHLKNGVPPGSVLAHSFLTSTLMTCLSRLPGSLFTQTTWPSCILQKTGTLTQDKTTLSAYLQKWKLKLSTTIMVTPAFHLYKEASCELKVAAEGCILPFSAEPTYPGIK